MMMRWDEMMSGPWLWGWGILWMLMMTAFWFMILLGLALVIRWLWRAGSRIGPVQPPDASAMEILKKRYARGEITREQYEQMRRDLE